MFHALAVLLEGLLLLARPVFPSWVRTELYHILVAVLDEYTSESDQHEGSDVQFLEMAERVLFRGIDEEHFDEAAN